MLLEVKAQDPHRSVGGDEEIHGVVGCDLL